MKIRETILVSLYDKSKTLYARYFKSQDAWNITKSTLLCYPDGTLGKMLGEFLLKNNFEMEDKLESHDVFHTIIGFDTKIEDEIAMQYFLLGNGKRSLYMFMVLLPATFLFPEHWNYFKKSYQFGKETPPFYHWDFLSLLDKSLQDIKQILFNNNLKTIKS